LREAALNLDIGYWILNIGYWLLDIKVRKRNRFQMIHQKKGYSNNMVSMRIMGCLMFFLVSVHLCAFTQMVPAEAVAYPRIPGKSIETLQKKIEAVEDIDSVTERRRACKNIIRRAESLTEKYPASPDRFRVLGIVFEVRKLMFTMRQTQEHRDALLATAVELLEAPDEYADIRLGAEVMLQEIELARDEGTPQERAMAIAELADRYRGTSAEAESLMMAAMIAFDIGHPALLNAFRKTLSKRFSNDPLVTAFMRERFAVGGEINVRGEFKRVDGKLISFPVGNPYLICFWSQDTPLLKERIAEIENLQERYKGQFKVFSFNLDELRDGGAGLLRRMKLEWIPLLLPGGTENPIYLSAGGANLFSALVVSSHGLARKSAIGIHKASLHKTYQASVGSPRYQMLLRSLCTGDFLVVDAPVSNKTKIPQDELDAIQDCFILPPMRYRLNPEEELNNYQKAETLCADATKKHADNRDLWIIHNRRIIALLGIWRLTGDSDFLERAEASAKAALTMDLPPGAGTVAQFCLAARALMCADADTTKVLNNFIEAVGGDKAQGTAYAAALMLSLEVHSRDQYIKFRNVLLAEYADDPSTWWVASFLLDQSVSAYVFERALPGRLENMPDKPVGRRLLTTKFTTLEGEKLIFPDAAEGKLTTLVFMEPTTDRSTANLQKRVLDHLAGRAITRPSKDLEVIAVFRSGDTSAVSALMKRNKWLFKVVCLSENEWQRSARELGLFSTDLRPNVYMTRPDGSIMFALSGGTPDTEKVDSLVYRIDMVLRDYDLALADKALAAENYPEYAARLATSFPLKNRKLPRHTSRLLEPICHQRKLVWAYMKAQDWQRALDSVNANIELQSGKHDSKKNSKIKWCRTCHGYLHAMFIRIALLREMGSKQQADQALALIDVPKCPLGMDVNDLWVEVKDYINGRRARFRHLKDPKVFLAEHERNMRSKCQSLYTFKLEHDLMMRARIQDKLGNPEAAEKDRRHAAVLAWPFKVMEFDLNLLHESSLQRRKQARRHLVSQEWQQAMEKLTTNIEIHEAEALRCNSMCKICAAQVQSFQYRARTLKDLGRTKEAEASLVMAEAIKCPPGDVRESFKCFPVNRMYGGGSGINRLNFIEEHMKGNVYANTKHRGYRLELASDLIMRAQAFEHLGDSAKAAVDRKRATALAYPCGPNAPLNADGLPASYVDILVVDDAQ